MAYTVFVDGHEGTTGLQINELLAKRKDIEVLKIDSDKRKDLAERRRLINASDVTFLCLPDDAAKESVTLVDNPKTCIIDASTAHMVRNPERFDVIVATNFYGDIISDLASELSGSLGLAGSMMASDTHCCAQAQHGSAPDIQGQDKANPTSMILSVAMLIRWMGEHNKKPDLVAAAKAMEEAVDKVLEQPSLWTADLGGKTGCKAFGENVAKAVASV